MPAETQFDKLADGNYFEWRIYMEAFLIRKQLLQVVNGTTRHPGGTEGSKKVQEFYRKQAEARAEIILRVSPSQLAHCRNADPMVIWNDLANIHSSHGRSTIIALRRRFHRLRLERGESMSAYIARVRHLAFLLEEAKVAVSDDDLILGITSGLPHSYDSFLISLDATSDSNYTVNNVIARLINEYQRQHQFPPRPQTTDNPQTDESMLVSEANARNNLAHITCFACGQKGHFQSSPNCPSRNKSNPAQPQPKDATHFVEEVDVDEDSDGVF